MDVSSNTDREEESKGTANSSEGGELIPLIFVAGKDVCFREQTPNFESLCVRNHECDGCPRNHR
jgi:hypothetical protein